MTNFFENIGNSIVQFTYIDVIDIILVSLVIYWLLKVTSRTRAMQVLRGVGVILVVYVICLVFNIQTMTWILNYVIGAGAIAIVILFQPELRAALERLGRGKIFLGDDVMAEDAIKSIEHIHSALLNLSKTNTGALIVIEQTTGLKDVLSSGTPLNALITAELLENIFYPNTPLHDGAVIIRGLRIAVAGCFLPLSANTGIARELGTRHRAALGISEVSDSVTLIVSEETGVISCAKNGEITRYINSRQLRELLEELFLEKPNGKKQLFRRKKSAKEAKSGGEGNK